MAPDQLTYDPQSYEAFQERYQARQAYLQLEKPFGSVAPDVLFNYSDILSTSQSSTDLVIAGSASAEALLTMPRPTLDDIDDSLRLLDWTGECFLAAQACAVQEIERFDPTGDQIEVLRAELHGLFVDLHKDLLCGEITKRTISELRAGLERLGVYTAKLLSLEAGGNFDSTLGFAFELATIIAHYQQYQTDVVMLPATPRADSGEYFNDVSHDIVMARPSEDGLVAIEGFQLKGRVREEDASHYDTSQITLVDVYQDLGLDLVALRQVLNPRATPRQRLLAHTSTTLRTAYALQHPHLQLEPLHTK